MCVWGGGGGGGAQGCDLERRENATGEISV